MFRNLPSARIRSRWWTLIVVFLTTASLAQRGLSATDISDVAPALATKPSARPAKNDSRSGFEALSSAAHAQIAATIGEDDPGYHVRPQPDGWRIDSARHGVSAAFNADGVEFALGATRWGMALRGHGYGDTLHAARATPPTVKANRVEYRRGTLTEWYVNGPLGIEQGFTLEQAPGHRNGEPMTVALTTAGNVTPSVAADGRALTLTKDGTLALRYGALTAWDADGRELPSWLEVDQRELRIRVDETGARYPLTIDPYVQAPALTTATACDANGICDDGAPYTQLGYSLSISADASTVVVGAPGRRFNNSQIQSGVAYVFVKPPDFQGGWNSGWGPNYFKTKLIASESLTTYLTFAESVDISRDGSTIVVGGRGVGAYVFLRPAFGWGTSATQTQNARLTAIPLSNERNPFIGRAVAISGDAGTIAVGALGLEIDTVRRGAAYVFLKPATGWVNAVESQKFTGIAGSEYGHSIALSDDAKVLVAGAPGSAHGDPSVAYGKAHVLARFANPGSADFYASVAELLPSDRTFDDRFGSAVSADGNGNTIVVGNPGSGSSGTRYGGAYVYVRPTGGWGVPSFSVTETAILTASDSLSLNTGLGWAVDISVDGRTIVAGSGPAEEPVGQTAAYFFAKPTGGWSTSSESAKVLPWDALQEDWFGNAATLSADGSVAVIGAFGKEVDASLMRGVAYVFTGNATAPNAEVSPSSVSFALQTIGTTSSPKTVTLTNSGTAPLHVTSVGVIGQFTTTQHCVSASPIAPGGSCSESVAFAPLSAAPLVGTLTFTNDSGGIVGALQNVQLQGEGKKVDTFTTITSLSSNRALVNQPVIVSFSVTSEPGSVYTPSGPVSVQASTGESCGAGVTAGYCTLVFSTAKERTITASFHGNNAYLNSSTSAPVTVQVADFSISASPSSQAVGTKKATFALAVTPVSGSTGTVSLSCNGGPPNATCAVSPGSVSLGGPASPKASVTLPNNAASGTYTITFTGTFGSGAKSTTATLVVK